MSRSDQISQPEGVGVPPRLLNPLVERDTQSQPILGQFTPKYPFALFSDTRWVLEGYHSLVLELPASEAEFEQLYDVREWYLNSDQEGKYNVSQG